jgi:hypothetical protein
VIIAHRVSPEGTCDNSPPIHRWEERRRRAMSPGGTTERFNRPYGTDDGDGLSPTNELVDYYQASLRDGDFNNTLLHHL